MAMGRAGARPGLARHGARVRRPRSEGGGAAHAVAWPARRVRSIRVQRRFDAAAERVFAAWLDPDVARRWLFATASSDMTRVAIDARVDGTFELVDRHAGSSEYRGRYTVLDAPGRLAFELSLAYAPLSHVTVDIVARDRGCDLALTHRGVPVTRAAGVAARWSGILYGLRVILASEFDNRQPGSAR
jgi:uncharacterized protein YndB with AHSA1/START domain